MSLFSNLVPIYVCVFAELCNGESFSLVVVVVTGGVCRTVDCPCLMSFVEFVDLILMSHVDLLGCPAGGLQKLETI